MKSTSEATTCSCLGVSMQTMESCSMSILDGHTMDGEGFISVDSTKHRVFAMNRWSKGHVIAWCDGTTNRTLLDSVQLRRYLGQKATPKIAAFGNGTLCGPSFVPDGATYLGGDLPARYRDNATALAADYDALLFCGFMLPWSWDFSRELVDYVTVHGRGLFLSMDYIGAPGLATARDFDKMNAIANQAGINFDKVRLGWSTAKLDFKMECVPDLPASDQ